MTPLIIVGKTKTSLTSYLKKYLKDNLFPSYLIYEIKPLKQEIVIAQIRQLKKELSLIQTGKRLVIFYNLDNSSLEVQNALLKTLEEKNEAVQFIILVNNLQKIIPTIQSRSKVINLSQKIELNLDQRYVKILEKVEKSKQPDFLAEVELDRVTREQSLEFINQLLIYYRQKLVKDSVKASRIIKQAMILKNLIENNNLNPQLTLDSLLIFIWKTYNMN